jgi:hypothetical protein
MEWSLELVDINFRDFVEILPYSLYTNSFVRTCYTTNGKIEHQARTIMGAACKGQGQENPICNPFPSLQCFYALACALCFLPSISRRA